MTIREALHDLEVLINHYEETTQGSCPVVLLYLRDKLKEDYKPITREDIVTLLTMEAGGFDYWCEISYKESDYIKAREQMKELGVEGSFGGTSYCHEDVLAYMITDTNYKVYAFDFEEDMSHLLTQEMLENGFYLNKEHRPQDANIEEGDAVTGDCILQYACFGQVIYG